MKLKFDSNQQFQLDAINAIVNIFDGLPLNNGGTQVSFASQGTGLFENIQQNELGIGNHLTLSDVELLANVHKIQDRNDVERTPILQGKNFSIEMETGTGKTYVYLRTIFELHKQYGFTKFVIVVPSVAIREGTLKNLQITEEHFKSLYDNVPFNYAVYDSKNTSIIKNFAVSNQLQILVINIDAFRKDFSDTDTENKGVLFHRVSEKLNGRSPREYVQSVHPIVIIDEPQSVDSTPRAQMAIQSLNPLCTLRYSATHINPYNLLYKLDPIKSYALRLVKKISVSSAQGLSEYNDAYVKLLEVDNRRGIKAKIAMIVNTGNGIVEKTKKVSSGQDLYAISGNYAGYQNGFQISEISCEPGNEFIQFSPSGIKLQLGQEHGGIDDDIKRIQIKNTIEEHLKKLKQVKDKGIKVLSLFFIDRVVNYRSYDGNEGVSKGKYAVWFEEIFHELSTQEAYRDLIPHSVEDIHDGYFAADKNGKWKDTKGNTKDDESTYDKIMKNKEQLLSLEEPLQFIFSHSALREGWDNPNVFQICTLNETNAVMKKRQEIGRGLRLPVNQDGERVFDDAINKLVVIANESYEEFARKLQTEYETDCGVKFGKIPVTAFMGIHRYVNEEDVEVDAHTSAQIWDNIKQHGYIDDVGILTELFNPNQSDFNFHIDAEFNDISYEIVDIMETYRIEKHIAKHENPRNIALNRQVLLDDNFKELWDKISQKTTYSVNYSTEELIQKAAQEITNMPQINPIRVQYVNAEFDIDERGVVARETRNQIIQIENDFILPDILLHLQENTNLLRRTIYQILIQSGRLNDFTVNPQAFIKAVTQIIKSTLNKLVVQGIKYERIAGQQYEMQLFEQGEIVSYLNELLATKKSIYDYIEYDSEVEKRFAQDLEMKESIKLFVKLPAWFVVDTPVGKYNPDWAIIKHDDDTLYLVRETKGTLNFDKLRNSEAYKIRCGEKHFEELGVDFKTVINAGEL